MNVLLEPLAPLASKDSEPAWIDASGISLRYVLAGAVGSEAAGTVVLIHELGGSIASWDAIVSTLSASRRVLRYDQRGHGDSEKVRAPFSLADQVDDLRTLLDALSLNEPCWLVAAAAGAAIAVEFAARYPARVAGIVMCAPALDVDPSRRGYLRERAQRARTNGMRAIIDSTLEQSWPPVLRADPRALDAYRGYRARLLANDPVCYALANDSLSNIDLRARLPDLRCPCLLLAGEHDLQRPPARISAQAALIAGSVFDTVPAGHLMAVQQPAHLLDKIQAFIDGDDR
ncbi:alpha/beta fold hydrolase [Paraburkholderia sp. UYCP14C]|uniref:alpha/beta fold hydrolase n=1 Tax=Paraburkholderia sp. UYCP14C TaxID=2511130 RepID=UPI00102274D7|nr:alpha/beta fold hydrolase [Paraburkholderia sp. UYCP14C]RZF30905.1 alpha/beta fold hydrolase [Paraburkholderia sp. UYCP14C]